MKMKILLLISVALLLTNIGYAETIPLKEVLKPWIIAVDDDQLYVAEKFSIQTFSLGDFKLKKQFGRRGRGPGDFPVILHVHITSNELAISSLFNLHFFSKDGVYKRELKSTAFSGCFIPLGKGYVGSASKDEGEVGYFTINLFDSALEKGAEIYRYKHAAQAKGKVNPLAGEVVFRVFKDMLLVAGKDDCIHVFDNKGAPRGKIIPAIKKNALTNDYKKQYFRKMKADKRQKIIYEMFRDRLELPSFFPLIRFFLVDDEHIYVISYEQKDHLHKCVTLGLDGKITGQYWVPLVFSDLTKPYPFTIHNKTFYQLVDDPDEEVWKLCVQKLENKKKNSRGKNSKQ